MVGFYLALGIFREFLFLFPGQLGWVVLCWTRNLQISFKLLPREGEVSNRLEEPVPSLLSSLGALPSAVETSKQKPVQPAVISLGAIGVSCVPYRKVLHGSVGKKEQVSFLSSPVEWFHTSFMQLLFFFLAQVKEPSLLGVLPLNFLGDREGRKQREVFGRRIVCKAAWWLEYPV